jgi:pimeloyl-ACP methyl ester carboxylesterase
MSNAAIKGGQIAHAPGWRAEIARVGIKGWSDRLMEMRFVPNTVAPEALAWFAGVQENSPAHVAIGLGELLVSTDLTSELAKLNKSLLLMMPDRSPYVSLAQAAALAQLVPQAEIAVFPGTRHGLPLSHGKQAASTLLKFLRRVEARN